MNGIKLQGVMVIMPSFFKLVQYIFFNTRNLLGSFNSTVLLKMICWFLQREQQSLLLPLVMFFDFFYNIFWSIRASGESHNFNSLLFAARLQLLQLVILSIQNSRCSVMFLPTKVIKKVTHFLWKGSAKEAKVSLDWICHSKAEGGLGDKNLFLWNKVCMTQNSW